MDEMRLQEIKKMLKTSHFNARMNALNEVRMNLIGTRRAGLEINDLNHVSYTFPSLYIFRIMYTVSLFITSY